MRLTQKYPDGEWNLRGLPWEDIRIGKEITGSTWKKLYGALCKLKDYEDTGLSPEQVGILAEKNEPEPSMLDSGY